MCRLLIMAGPHRFCFVFSNGLDVLQSLQSLFLTPCLLPSIYMANGTSGEGLSTQAQAQEAVVCTWSEDYRTNLTAEVPFSVSRSIPSAELHGKAQTQEFCRHIRAARHVAIFWVRKPGAVKSCPWYQLVQSKGVSMVSTAGAITRSVRRPPTHHLSHSGQWWRCAGDAIWFSKH